MLAAELAQFDTRVRKLISAAPASHDVQVREPSLQEGVAERKIADCHHNPQKPIEYVAELKYDGVAVSLHYHDGKLVRALSRGDGRSVSTCLYSARREPHTCG